ncbi:glycosyltransferase family 61 protein [Pseudorhodobacter sp. E13]|uniref:glycosyltransferase family 61 protein n=1 Tax=Pseudorhodobacter sp. E13 TaxID=2487931 RepID=UPI000F8C8089|nr:glycosyltransferase family 61 protein [Pseudorhodobacter sp. E13]RUS59588.1 glycosyltransferase family 61 protein [Pseudorhodobacter sp. E13]
MRNQISFHQDPQDLFLNPAQDSGVTLLFSAAFFWREVEPALITGFASSAYPEMNHKIEAFLTVTRRHKAFSKAVEFNTVPVLLQNASFRKSFSLANDKCLLSGASGTRLLNRYCWENEEEDHDPEETLVAYFRKCQAKNHAASIPVWQGPLPQGVAIAIECRNTFNYYHFITESLSQLAVLAEIGFAGDIFFHFPNNPEKTRPFAADFVAALFPELAGRVFFERAPKDYDYVITALDFFSTYFQFPAEVVGSLDHLAPSDAMWRGQDAYRGSQAILAMNSFHASLRALRKRALAAIEGHDFSHLPKRFFVGRDRTQARDRKMDGEAQLFEMLQLFGFDYVVFEHLTPLDQIALMANAEMMVSYHGAGFTNMLFAGPQAYVLELGTLQTAIYRWGDFWSIAHAAGCRYVSFFADYNKADPLQDPSFDVDGIVPVALSDRAVAEVMTFIVSILGKTPDLPSAQTVQILAERLIAVHEFDRVLLLLERHARFVPGHLALCLAKAECHKHRGEFHSELFALHQAYEADRERWQTLIRMIWCAKKCDAPDVMTWALACLRHDFPKRYAVLTKTKPWMRQIA